MNNLLSTKYELNLLRAVTSNRPISYVRVPRTKSDNAFTNLKEWLDTTIKILGSQHGGTFDHSVQHQRQRVVPAFLGGVHSVGRGIFVSSNCESDGIRHKNLPEICIGSGAWQRCSASHCHPQGSHDAQAHRISQMRYIRGGGGLGNKMKDWVERLQQTRMHLRQRFCTVQNPVIHVLSREKANSCSLHPDVVAHTNATNAGNKRSFSVMKV